MREIITKKWGELAEEWRDLYNKNNTASPFQSYEYLSFTGKGKLHYKYPFRLVGLKELNLILYRDKEAAAIAPLLIKKKKNKNMIFFRGHFTKAGRLDFIYKDGFDYDDFEFLMDGIKQRLCKPSFFLDRICERSPVCSYMKRYFKSGKTDTKTCYYIPLPKGYEEWLKNLHKSKRNNLSNHMHRLERDHINVRLKVLCKTEVDDDTLKKMMKVYADRYMIKNNCRLGPFRRVALKIVQAILLRDKTTLWLKNTPNNFNAILYFGKEIAAFTSGLFCPNSRIALIRLAINTKFAKYGPGGVLISSVIRYIIEQNNLGAMNIKEIHMGEGGNNGMEYKKASGGLPYDSYTFIT